MIKGAGGGRSWSPCAAAPLGLQSLAGTLSRPPACPPWPLGPRCFRPCRLPPGLVPQDLQSVARPGPVAAGGAAAPPPALALPGHPSLPQVPPLPAGAGFLGSAQAACCPPHGPLHAGTQAGRTPSCPGSLATPHPASLGWGWGCGLASWAGEPESAPRSTCQPRDTSEPE